MKQNQVGRRLYEEPRIQVIGIKPYSCLLGLSGSGGHHGAADDEELNAKQGWFDEEKESIDN